MGESMSLSALISRLARLLAGGGPLSPGDVAALRRMHPARPAPAFFKIEGLVLDDQLPGDATALAEAETRWAAIIVGLVHLGPLHQSRHRFGRALVDAQYSELRFTRLVRGDADRLAGDLPMLARFLAAKGTPVDWTGAAHLMLSAGRSDEERVRRQIARDYYGSLSRLESR